MTNRVRRHRYRLTVLRAVNKQIAAKTVRLRRNGKYQIQDYSYIKHFNIERRGARDIRSLSRVLHELENDCHTLVIRGEPRPDRDTSGRVTRTSYDIPSKRQQAFFRSVPNGIPWLCIDLDEMPLPECLSIQDDPEAVVRHAISKLPSCFHNVTCHWQFSSSAGVRQTDKIKLHLWFWLDRNVTDQEAKRWAKQVNQGSKFVDPALYEPVQAHYTAAPVFRDGIPDPLQQRSGLLRGGDDCVQFPEVPEAPIQYRATCGRGISASDSFEDILETVGDHPGGQGFHVPLRDAVWVHVCEHGTDTDPRTLRDRLLDTIRQADKSDHSDDVIRERASDDHLYGLIESAITKLGNSRRTGLILGLPPHFP
jgi:hypothetical protein